MSGAEDHDLSLPSALRDLDLSRESASSLLAGWGHTKPRRFVRRRTEEGRLEWHGEPPRLHASDLWREVLRDECDKLYNQAWCALDQIREAEDEQSVMMLAVDDFPSAVEQAWSLAPPLANEHLELLREYRQERLDGFLGDLAVGTDRETDERMECIAFWLENAEDWSELRRNLFRMVLAELTSRAGTETGERGSASP